MRQELENFRKLIKANSEDWLAILNEAYEDVEFNDDWSACKFLVSNGYNVKCVEQYGGEGQGDTYFVIFTVTKGEVSFSVQVDGWYQSHYGHEFHNPTELVLVEQKQVTVMDWVVVDERTI